MDESASWVSHALLVPTHLTILPASHQNRYRSLRKTFFLRQVVGRFSFSHACLTTLALERNTKFSQTCRNFTSSHPYSFEGYLL